MSSTTMRGPDYLRTLDTPIIERAYQQTGKGYTRGGDEAAAALLQQAAALQGITVELRGVTLGKERSSRGLVAFKSPRGPLPVVGASKIPASQAPPQPELPGVQEDSATRAGWAAVAKVDKLLAGQSDILTVLKEIKTLLVGMTSGILLAAPVATFGSSTPVYGGKVEASQFPKAVGE